MTKGILQLVADIVSGQAQRKPMERAELLDFITLVHRTLSDLSANSEVEAVIDIPGLRLSRSPAVPIEASVFPDYIICLEDGKRMKMLKRHLSTAYQMTPDEYRARWELPDSYPLVAPNYAVKRSQLAKAIGLGRKPGDVRWTGRVPGKRA